MRSKLLKIALLSFTLLTISCKQNNDTAKVPKSVATENKILYAKGFSINKYEGFSVVKVNNPWPNANKKYTYVLQEKNGIVPDSLNQFDIISVPIKTIVATSTTHLPSLEMLGVENTLIGFPQLNYISSEKIWSQIEKGKVKEVGNNQNLNTEVIIDLQPSVIIGYGIDNNNPALDNLQKSGLKVLLNGDWNEQTPLGKAEWIKLFGALYALDKKADSIFTNIEKEYKKTVALAATAKTNPTVLVGAMFNNQWFVPKGDSWGCLFIKEAHANYLWSDVEGTGGLSLSFETVLDKAKTADFWIGPGSFDNLKQLTDSNIHYNQFDAFKSKNVYSYSVKKGRKGGLVYFELAPNRPDLVLKDMVKIVHPELLPDYKLFFFERLK